MSTDHWRILQNTDRYCLAALNGNRAAVLTDKKRGKDVFLQHKSAMEMLSDYLSILKLRETEGSVYYTLTLNQCFAQIYANYEHLEEDFKGIAEYVDRLTLPN